MSEPQQSPRKKSKAKPESQLVSWISRGVIFGTLGILLILAVMDFQAKQAATGTAEAWRNALRSKTENADLTKSEFDKIAVRGRPTVSSEKAGHNAFAAVTMDTYVWKGTFNTYTVKVYFGLGTDPPVDQIEGPGAIVDK
jgi:hypothetical protein